MKNFSISLFALAILLLSSCDFVNGIGGRSDSNEDGYSDATEFYDENGYFSSSEYEEYVENKEEKEKREENNKADKQTKQKDSKEEKRKGLPNALNEKKGAEKNNKTQK